jgi:hypothetical protein
MMFIDGAAAKARELDRMKILVNGTGFLGIFSYINEDLRSHDDKMREVTAKNYPTLMEAMLREHCTDITSQLISACNTALKPKLKNHLSGKSVLFDAAIKLLIEETKAWAGHLP